MKNYLMAFACAATMAALGMGSANAEVMTTAAKPGLCLDVNASNNQVILWTCHGGANQNFFNSNYGAQTYNGLCLDFEGVGATQQRAGLQMRGCDSNRRSQRWLLVNDPRDPNVGRLRNEEGWCVNILGGDSNAQPNTRPAAWTCQTGGARNDIWARGGFGSSGNAGLSATVVTQLNQNGLLIRNAAGIVAAGGGNIVAAGGGNIVAAGGGNIITTSGGAIVAAGGGNIVAAGGGNLGPMLNGAALTNLSNIGLQGAAGVMVHLPPN